MKTRILISGLLVFITALLSKLNLSIEFSVINGTILGCSTGYLFIEIGDLIDIVEEIKNNKE